MGRQVEDAFLSYLMELAVRGGAQVVRGIYRPTPKNGLVQHFYSQHGFVAPAALSDAQGDHAEAVYEAELRPGAFAWPKLIRRASPADKENVSV
jgi:hypothetical protein